MARRNRRAGKTTSSFIYLNSHGLRSALLEAADSFSNHSISFFSETWLHGEASSTPLIAGKDLFDVPAVKPPGRGRPSGGLQLYVHPKFNAKLISSDFNHIAVSLPHLTFVGLYFRPGADLDDIVMTIATALNHAPPRLPVLIGGDLNVHPGSHGLQEICNLLLHYDITLISDSNTPTFIHPKGASCLDYVFASLSVELSSVNILPLTCSDHLPLQVKLKLARNIRTLPTTVNASQQLDVDAVATALLDPALLDLAIVDLVGKVDSIFSSCTRPLRKKKVRKPWFSTYSFNLRKRCTELLKLARVNPTYRAEYCIARKAYHTHLRASKRAFQSRERDKIVSDALEKGLPSLFRHAKEKASASSIPLPDLFRYAKNLFSHPEPELESIPTCDNPNHPLLDPFSAAEIRYCLSSLKSKACSASGAYSPYSLKLLGPAVVPLLVRIYNECFVSHTFPTSWLETVLFFLHKKGVRTNPGNYRTIAIENPFLKVFMLLLSRRISLFAEGNDLLPDMQFGFRPSKSCMSAASLLYLTASKRLSQRKRTYVAFIDFTKAFDSVDRTLLFRKLLLLGLPRSLCIVLFSILSSIDFRVRQDSFLSPPFRSQVGTPQGDPLSPLLFSLFLHDLPDSLRHPSLKVPDSDVSIPCLLYADDTTLLADTSADLQIALDSLYQYCVANKLTINIRKSKFLVFHKGRLPTANVHINGDILERVNEFQFLGLYFTSQLTFSNHLLFCAKKANARVGFLFNRLPLKDLPLNLIIQLFNVFILPIFLYGSHIWLTKFSVSAGRAANAVFTKFLKRYLCIPVFSLNSLTHFFTLSRPLLHSVQYFAFTHAFKAGFPPSLSNVQLTFVRSLVDPPPFSPIPDIPTVFWLSNLPLSPSLRRSLILPLVSPFFPPALRNFY
jgi:hypothetical protein